MKEIVIDNQPVGMDHPVYFIADIAANHDGDLSRAKDLISIAKEHGADAAKFQHFRAPKIVSDFGFRQLGSQLSHQSKWKKSVYEVYEDASLDWKWTEELYMHCKKENIHFFSSPYDFEVIDMLDSYMPAYKIGSGDISWHEIIIKMAKKDKPILLATGASDIQEVIDSANAILKYNKQLVIMQCNTNYTGSVENFKYIALNVLQSYKVLFPDVILGLSDHTPGHTTVIGAVALGARVIEKHFTDDNDREGPDHPFSMNPQAWQEMVERSRELEAALGPSIKKVEDNEKDTAVLQRRCLRAAKDLPAGHILTADDIEVLRPAPKEALKPVEKQNIIGKRIRDAMVFGQHFTWNIIDGVK